MKNRLLILFAVLIALWFYAGRPPFGPWGQEQAKVEKKISDLETHILKMKQERKRVDQLKKWIKKLEEAGATSEKKLPEGLDRADDRLQTLQDEALAHHLILLKAQGPSDTVTSGLSEKLTVEGSFGDIL